MPRPPLPDELVQQLLDEHAAGFTRARIAEHHGLSVHTVRKYLTEHGVPPAAVPAELPDGQICARYLAGESENALAKAFGVNRWTIRRRLDRAGVERRGRGEANRRMMAARTPEENRRNTEASHRAATGRKATLEERCKCALSRERNPSNVGMNEPLLSDMLAERGVTCVPQKAVGPYNCDLAAGTVAVEVFGGNFHFGGRHWERLPKRLRYLLDRGWSVIMVVVDAHRHPLTGAGAQQVVAFIERLSSNPAARREYRMIRGTGELMSAGSDEDDERTIVETLGRGRNGRRKHTG